MTTKKENNILGNIPPGAADFIKIVIKNMRYRKAVRKEVMTELAAHFEDELKDCKTEQEKAEKAKQLIGEFGDPKLLGVLLRRAKKRCRPLWRTMVVRAFQTIGLLIVFLFVYIAWFLTGKPVINVDYVAEFNRIVRPVADESQNAAPLYEQAIQLFKSRNDYNDVKGLLGKKYEDANSTEKGKIDKWLVGNKEVLDLAYEGAKKSYFWQTYRNQNPNEGVMGVLLTNLAGFRELANLLILRAQLAAEQGRYEDSFNDLIACYRFGRHIRQGNVTLVEQLVGIAIEALSANQIREILATNKIDSTSLSILQKNLEQIIAGEDFGIRFSAEKLCGYDEIQRTFTDDSITGGHLYSGDFLKLLTMTGSYSRSSIDVMLQEVVPKIPYILFFHPNKKESKIMLERYYEFLEEISKQTPAQIRSEEIDVDKEALKIVKGNLVLEMFTPALGRVIEVSNRNKIDIKATITIIALQRYNQDKGQYPDSLQELIKADHLKELPIDPWSDKPLVYKKTNAGFTLYSVGLNFKDDGGVIARDGEGRIRIWDRNEGDAVFWPAVK